MKSICYVVTAVLITCCIELTHAQVTAPGQGGNVVLWTALEVEQAVGKRWTSHTTLGMGRHSSLEDYAILEQKGVITIRQGVSYKLTNAFTSSLTAMYAQRAYAEENLPPFQREIRLYPKLKHAFTVSAISFSHSIRLDGRAFYQPGWSAWKTPFEIRPRYQLKASLPLSPKKRNFIILLTEVMASSKAENKIIDEQQIRTWQPFQFTENRTSLYFRHQLKTLNWYLDLGLMHQYWRQKENHFHSTVLLQADLIIKNPFGSLRLK